MLSRILTSVAIFIGDTMYMILHEFRRWAVPVLVALILVIIGAVIYRETGIDIKELMDNS